MALQPGITLTERYKVISVLGEGGMGAAYLVQDNRLNRRCVIKEVLAHEATSQEQFEREAQLLAILHHPHLPVVHDYFFDNNNPYIVMQYIDGPNINQLADKRTAAFEIHDVLKWAKELLDALIYMHNQTPPIIHRDVKPHNVCITPENNAVLVDFGIARRLDESHTHTAAQALTPNYSPIEQYPENTIRHMPSVLKYVKNLHSQNFHTGFYSDIYGLGCTLYYSLCLLPPLDACMRIVGETLIPIQERNSEVPKFLAHAVMKALELHPQNRFQSAEEMLTALQPESVEVGVVRLGRHSPRELPSKNVFAFDQELIYIPSGDFLMGSDDPALKDACHPQHMITLCPYCISRFPVTNSDYQRFIEDNPAYTIPFSPMRYAQRHNWDRKTRTYPRGLEYHPVVLVTWLDAISYCSWLSEVTGYQIRLPSEAEWEKAARWDLSSEQSRNYPWGDDFDEEKCNVDFRGELRLMTSRMGLYSPEGDSPFGLADMAGNVWEWTTSLYQPFPYIADDDRENPETEGKRVIRGGAYDEGLLIARCAWRNAVSPDQRLANVGFRVVCDAE